MPLYKAKPKNLYDGQLKMGIMGWTCKNVDKVIRNYKLKCLFKNQFSDVYSDKQNKYILKIFRSAKGASSNDMYYAEKKHLEILSNVDYVNKHIPKILEHDDKEKFILMEHKGTDGIELINNRQYNSIVFEEFINQVPKIIDAINKEGYVHRDIKPENLVYDVATKTWSVIDFAFMEPSVHYGHIDFKGTFPYCAPFLGNKQYLQEFLRHNKLKDIKICADYFSFALAAFSLEGNPHITDENDMAVEVSLSPIYSTIINPKASNVMKALAEVVLSCVNVGYSSITWYTHSVGGRNCSFTDVFKCGMFKNRKIEKDVIKCWEKFTTIIEKQNVKINCSHVQTETKYE